MKVRMSDKENNFQDFLKNSNFETPNVSFIQDASLIKHGLGTTNITAIEEADQVHLNINPNTLQFKKALLEDKFKSYLVNDSENKATREFKVNLLIYFIFFFFVIALSIMEQIINFLQDSEEIRAALMSIIILSVIAVIGFVSCILLGNSKQMRKKSQLILVTLTIILQSYLIIFNEQLLDKVFNLSEKFHLDNSLFICGTIYVSQLVLFSNYLGLSIICIYTVSLYFISLIIQKKEYHVSISNIIILGHICFAFILNSYRTEKLMKTVFMVKNYNKIYSKDESNVSILMKKRNSTTQNQEIDQYILKRNQSNKITKVDKVAIQLHAVKQYLIYSADLIMFSDVKQGLLLASKDLENILKIILTQENLFKVDVKEFLEGSEINDEDKAFVMQNYLDPSKEKSNPFQYYFEKRQKQKKKTTYVQNINKSVIQGQTIPEVKNFLQKVGKD